VSGEIDLTTSDAFEQELTHAIGERALEGIVVDLSRVTFMDSSALNALVRAFELQRAGLRSMSLVTDDRRVLVLLEVTRLDQIIPIFPTRDEALTARIP
jgi:anti-anti-sigma factor